MRVWDFSPKYLCRTHLIAQHREIHAIWTIVTNDKPGGYRHHPGVKRWFGHLAALYRRHEDTVQEMLSRGYQHNSPLDIDLATGSAEIPLGQSLEYQRDRVREKCLYLIPSCQCRYEEIQYKEV